jgi:hypothetical protein
MAQDEWNKVQLKNPESFTTMPIEPALMADDQTFQAEW